MKNKAIYYSIITILFFLVQKDHLYAQDYDPVLDFTTPRHSPVVSAIYKWYVDYSPQDIHKLDSIYAVTYDIDTIGHSSRTYNCHGYAWDTDAPGRYQIGKNGAEMFLAEEYGGDGSYDEVGEDVATHVWYSLNHSAIIDQSDTNYYFAKWGDGPLVRHKRDIEKYPEGYGKPLKFFRRSVDVPEDSWGMDDALSRAVKGQTVRVSVSDDTSATFLFNSLSIPTGITLKIMPGVNINFNNKYIELTGGTFDIQNGSTVYLKDDSNRFRGLFTSIQEAINQASPGWRIELKAGTFNESFSLSNKDGIYIYGNGALINGNVAINNSNNCNLYDLHMGNGHYFEVNYGSGLRIINAINDNPLLMNVYGSSNFSASGFNATNGNENEIGTYFYNSTGNFGGGSTIENYMCGINLGMNSRISITYTYFCNNGLDVYSEGALAYLENNTYSRINPLSVSGNYSYQPAYPENCCQSEMMVNTSGKDVFRTNAVTTEVETDKIYLDILKDIDKDKLKDHKSLKDKYRPEINNIISKTKDELNKGIDLRTLKSELSRLVHCYKWLNEKEILLSFLEELLRKNELKEMFPYIRRYFIEGLLDVRDYKEALRLADDILKTKGIDQDLTCEMLYEKGIINKYFINNDSEAFKMFSILTSQYPNHTLSSIAKGQLYSLSKRSDNPYFKSVSEIGNELKCTNYPNPFNPITRFNLSIPNDSYCELKIYNSLGQEVKRLVSENLTKGQYSFEWNANNFSSGIYFYTLKSGDRIISSKIILMK